MSESYDIKIYYDVPFRKEINRTLLDALRSAVEDNWERSLRDEWSAQAPPFPVNVDGWLAELIPERMYRPEFRGETWGFQSFDFSFSPLSSFVLTLFLTDRRDGILSAMISVPPLALSEQRGQREMDRVEDEWDAIRRDRGEDPIGTLGPDEVHPDWEEWQDKYWLLGDTDPVWPGNRESPRHIVECLRVVLPVRQLEIDEELELELS